MLGALGAHAQRADEPRIPSDIGLRRDSRLQAHDWGELRLLKALGEIDWKLTLGMAYTHAENGDQVTSTPFQLRARFNEGRTAFKLTGSGYVHVRSEDRSINGFNDVNVMMTQLVALEWPQARGRDLQPRFQPPLGRPGAWAPDALRRRAAAG